MQRSRERHRRPRCTWMLASATAAVANAPAAAGDAVANAPAAAGDAAVGETMDSGDMYVRLMRCTVLNKFTTPGLEGAYCAYRVALWTDRFRTWVFFAAAMVTTGLIYIRATAGTSAEAAHPSLLEPMIGFCAFFCKDAVLEPASSSALNAWMMPCSSSLC